MAVVDHMKIGPPDQETGEYFIHSREMPTHSSTGVKLIN